MVQSFANIKVQEVLVSIEEMQDNPVKYLFDSAVAGITILFLTSISGRFSVILFFAIGRQVCSVLWML